jgi:hypothetical protein
MLHRHPGVSILRPMTKQVVSILPAFPNRVTTCIWRSLRQTRFPALLHESSLILAQFDCSIQLNTMQF